MNPATSAIIDRLIASRDRLKGFAIPSDDDLVEARDAMADAANALDSYAKTFEVIEQSSDPHPSDGGRG